MEQYNNTSINYYSQLLQNSYLKINTVRAQYGTNTFDTIDLNHEKYKSVRSYIEDRLKYHQNRGAKLKSIMMMKSVTEQKELYSEMAKEDLVACWSKGYELIIKYHGKYPEGTFCPQIAKLELEGREWGFLCKQVFQSSKKNVRWGNDQFHSLFN